MVKRVYFAFHYQDVIDFRANVVRSHWLTKADRDAAGFFDASLWESARKEGDIGLKQLINDSLEGTSTTCILIGSQTYLRRWVRYEIFKSFKRGNSILAVQINSIAGKDQLKKPLGQNPLQYLGVTYSESGLTATIHEAHNSDWVEYIEVDGAASYRIDPVPRQYRGQGYNLGRLFPMYDWASGDGYNNFAEWVD
jgi:MTH538 TIR-like domain (DUF1863)